MSKSSTEIASVSATDPINEVKMASTKNSKEKMEAAIGANKLADENRQSIKNDLNTSKDQIALGTSDVKKLESVKNGLNTLAHYSNLAIHLTSEFNGVNSAQSIIDTTKSIKTVLDTIENMYPDAMAMDGKVNSVDVIDSEDVKPLIKTYIKKAKSSTLSVEIWKNEVAQIAINESNSLKIDVDDYGQKIKDFKSAIEKVQKDIDTIHDSKKADLDNHQKEFSAFSAKLGEIDIEVFKNKHIIEIGNKLISSSTPTVSNTTNKSKSNKKNKK